MIVYAWNINGYNSVIHKDIVHLLDTENIDILFLNEIKTKQLQPIKGYNIIINYNVPSNYHGVAMLVKETIKYSEPKVNLNIQARQDTKSRSAATGRIITIKVNNVYIVGVYGPNSGVRGLKNLSYRTDVWDIGLAAYLKQLGNNVILLGDLNIAFDNRDVSDPKSMSKWPGFTHEERKTFKTTMSDWIDIYRQFDPDGHIYTWIGDNPRANYGMRIDHIMLNNHDLLDNVDALFFNETIHVSDHIPIGVFINLTKISH